MAVNQSSNPPPLDGYTRIDAAPKGHLSTSQVGEIPPVCEIPFFKLGLLAAKSVAGLHIFVGQHDWTVGGGSLS